MGVSKNRGKTPKMDGENNGKLYCLMDDLGGKPPLFGNTLMFLPGLPLIGAGWVRFQLVRSGLGFDWPLPWTSLGGHHSDAGI